MSVFNFCLGKNISFNLRLFYMSRICAELFLFVVHHSIIQVKISNLICQLSLFQCHRQTLILKKQNVEVGIDRIDPLSCDS